MAQAYLRRLGHQCLKPSPTLSSLKPAYTISSGEYGTDHPRYGSTIATKGVGHLIRKGTGGRSSVSGLVATVFGATGFLGRYVVQQLAKMGSQVLVPFRGSEDSHRHLKLMGDLGQIVPMQYNPRDENSIKAVMAKANVVLNLIGREYETRNYSFEEVNYSMAEQLAMIAKEHGGIMRFIQVSCLGASPSSPSRMLRAKAAAEEAILRELPEATIMKPAIMVGTEDRILNRWAHFAKKHNFLALIGDGSTKIQPVYVVDVAAAIVAALKDDGTSMGKVYELGGPDIFTVHQLAELMYETIREWPRYVKVPFLIAKEQCVRNTFSHWGRKHLAEYNRIPPKDQIMKSALFKQQEVSSPTEKLREDFVVELRLNCRASFKNPSVPFHPDASTHHEWRALP